MRDRRVAEVMPAEEGERFREQGGVRFVSPGGKNRLDQRSVSRGVKGSGRTRGAHGTGVGKGEKKSTSRVFVTVNGAALRGR